MCVQFVVRLYYCTVRMYTTVFSTCVCQLTAQPHVNTNKLKFSRFFLVNNSGIVILTYRTFSSAYNIVACKTDTSVSSLWYTEVVYLAPC